MHGRIDCHMNRSYRFPMSGAGTRRVTANLPEELLEEACRVTGQGITQTLIQGLQMVRRTLAAQKAGALKGKLHLKLDLDVLRERSGH
jgi:hypothetical protein